VKFCKNIISISYRNRNSDIKSSLVIIVTVVAVAAVVVVIVVVTWQWCGSILSLVVGLWAVTSRHIQALACQLQWQLVHNGWRSLRKYVVSTHHKTVLFIATWTHFQLTDQPTQLSQFVYPACFRGTALVHRTYPKENQYKLLYWALSPIPICLNFKNKGTSDCSTINSMVFIRFIWTTLQPSSSVLFTDFHPTNQFPKCYCLLSDSLMHFITSWCSTYVTLFVSSIVG